MESIESSASRSHISRVHDSAYVWGLSREPGEDPVDAASLGNHLWNSVRFVENEGRGIPGAYIAERPRLCYRPKRQRGWRILSSQPIGEPRFECVA